MSGRFDPAPPALLRCRLCPRLAAHREAVARKRRRAYADQEYWGRPVPGFGDPAGPVLLLGLAPGAHGANRTGRMFTGDASGDFLFAALHRAGFASRPESVSRDDGMRLSGLYITAAARCVPPGNRPTRAEVASCRIWLDRELRLPGFRVVLALGRIAHDAYLDWLRAEGDAIVKARFPFAHGAEHRPDGRPLLVDSYHVSFQNTNTGRLTPAMFDAVLRRVRRLSGLPPAFALRSRGRGRSSA